MRYLVFVVLVCFIFTACESNDGIIPETEELVGDWKLISRYIDNGGGNGTFTAVESDKILSFLDDGTVTSNGDICSMSVTSDTPTSGTYSESESIIIPDNCEGILPNWNYSFTIFANTMTVNYPCIEPCRARFLKQ